MTNEKKPSELFSNHNELSNAGDILREIQSHEQCLGKALAEYLQSKGKQMQPSKNIEELQLAQMVNNNNDQILEEPKHAHGSGHGHGHHHHHKKGKQSVAHMEEFISK